VQMIVRQRETGAMTTMASQKNQRVVKDKIIMGDTEMSRNPNIQIARSEAIKPPGNLPKIPLRLS
jgi:hypothetical protein